MNIFGGKAGFIDVSGYSERFQRSAQIAEYMGKGRDGHHGFGQGFMFALEFALYHPTEAHELFAEISLAADPLAKPEAIIARRRAGDDLAKLKGRTIRPN